jgi:hypothetical protein
MSASAREVLWLRLRDAALVEGDMPARGDMRSPWYVRVMLGFAGWIGAVFLFGFVGAAFAFVMRSGTAAMLVGAAACAAAVAIFRASRGDFAGQFGLAVSLAGQAMLAYGIATTLGDPSLATIALLVAVQQAVLFVLVPSFVHRVFTSWSALVALQLALADGGLYAFAPALATAAFVATWLVELDHADRAELLRPGGYGVALAAAQMAVIPGALWYGLLLRHPQAAAQATAWAGAAASGAVLLGAVAALLRREGVAVFSRAGAKAMGAAAILAAASLKAPGLAPALAILVVGYANGNRVLAGLGIAALIGYLSQYYYTLDATLLEKSAVLAVTGIVLLAARLAMRHA